MNLERRVCDKETKINFRWSHVAEGVIVILLLGVIYGFDELRTHMQWSQDFHEEIPTNFFTGKRWSFTDELKSQNQTNLQITTLDKRMSLIEAQHRHSMETLKRIEDAVVK